MMNFSSWVHSHRRSILFFIAVLAIGGLIASFKMPTSLFPTVDFPRVVVSLDAGDQPPQQMELLVTRPVEEAVRRVPGVKSVRSTTARGSAEISVNFDWGLDMTAAALQVNAAMSQITSQLPPGTVIKTRRMDPTVFPIIAYSLTSKSVSPTQLYDIAEYQLRPLLSGVDGVARVQSIGGAVEEYQVAVDPQKLSARALSADDVSRALAASNVINVVGRLEDHYKLFLVMADARLQNLQQIGDVVVASGSNGIVRIRDVAAVTRSTVPQWIRVTADGQDSVLLSIYQQPGSNSIQIAKDIKAKIQDFQSQLPKGVTVSNWYDQSQLVTASASSVRDAILIGVALAAIVLLVFLRNLKITLIAVLVVPAVLATTVVLLTLLNMNFNIMTLGGMAAAVGLIIDDAIVMIEHIVRRLHQNHDGSGPIHGRVMDAAREFVRPLVGSSASTLVIFAPLAFLTGVTGAFFKALSITMASGLFISFLFTWLAVPVLAGMLLKKKDTQHDDGGQLTKWFHGRYEALMHRLLKRPVLVLLVILPLAGAGFIGFQKVGSGFMPSMDEGGFVLDYYSEPGTAVTETDRLVQQVEKIIRANPNVQTYSRRTGTGLGGGISEPNHGDFFVRLKQGNREPVDAVMEEVRTRIESDVPGIHVEMAQLMEDLIGDLTAVPQPIEVKIFSADPKELPVLAKKVAAKISKISGVVDVKDGINPAGDALQLHIDPVKAAREGLDAATISKSLSDSLGGNVATQLIEGVKPVGIRVWIPHEMRSTDNDLGNITVKAPDGHLVPLKRVTTFDVLTGQAEIARENLRQMIAVTGRISGRDLGSVVADVKAELDKAGTFPQGGYYQLGGLYEQQRLAFQGLMQVFAAAAVLVFLLLLFMYEDFLMASVILFTSLVSVSAVFVGLSLTGIDLNISAMMGMTMIIGIVTEVAIFYFSEQREVSGHFKGVDALVEAGKNRMRPIAMTTLAAILTLLPLAFAIGEGSEMQQPLAIAIISGLLVQLPLVLVVMPVLYNWLSGGGRLKTGN